MKLIKNSYRTVIVSAIIFEIGDGVFKSLLLFLIAFLIKKEKYNVADSDTLSVTSIDNFREAMKNFPELNNQPEVREEIDSKIGERNYPPKFTAGMHYSG